MRRFLRLVLAVIVGLVVGSVVNMSLILVSGQVIAPPAGADVTTTEGLKASIHLFEPRHLLFPFLAHGLGTFFGALVATLLTPGRTSGPAYVVGFMFLLGGIVNVSMLPAPVWFSAVDLIAAYMPAAWLAHRLGSRKAARVVAG
ncbi:MAG: hypothetical protein EOP91_06485 [Lysobacteraceae bacterium]|nr:MAG: hypothetical protein EOP91_06485 [Xanthomonadaceae bacterium]